MDKIWTCKIGEVPSVPSGADGPMRYAVADAYRQITGQDPAFIFSGWGGELEECERAVVENRLPILATRTYATPVAEAWAGMEAAMQDPDYAWGWHCNLAVPIMDATGITHKQANMAAAHLMQHLWKCDITTHPNYQYEKSDAQAYAEFRIEADKAEDAALPDAALEDQTHG